MAEAEAKEAEAEAEVEAAMAEVPAEVGSGLAAEASVELSDAVDLLAEAPLPIASDPDGPPTPPGDADAPTLRIPGRVLHLYPVYGAYRATWVPNDFPPLCSITLAPHMIHDHRGKSYLAALRGVKAAAAAADPPPAWEPFSATAGVCAVCAAPFSWQSTCRSAAQDVCAQHHCRACGKVVCAACSTHAACLPDFGIVEPARVCDACFWKL
jgi:growth factor-regulated tyrosine kinase substrate